MSKIDRSILLLDPTFIERFIAQMRDEAEHPQFTPDTCIKTIKEYVLNPIEQYLDGEWKKGKWDEEENQGLWLEAMNHVWKFKEAVEDLIFEYEQVSPVNYDGLGNYIDNIEIHWNAFQRQICVIVANDVNQSRSVRKKIGEDSQRPKKEKAKVEEDIILKYVDEILANNKGEGKPIVSRIINKLKKQYNVTLRKTRLYEIINIKLKE